jgi:hypothetical protein
VAHGAAANTATLSLPQTIAILATATQESGLHPTAVSPNRLWRSIFQHDRSYPGRGNPNVAIAEFFDRLDRYRGPASRDIWKSIFWLQQRKDEPSAQAAYEHGRQAYLDEIGSQKGRAEAMYRGITEGRFKWMMTTMMGPPWTECV